MRRFALAKVSTVRLTEGTNWSKYIRNFDLCTHTWPYRLAMLGTSLRVRGQLTLRKKEFIFLRSKPKNNEMMHVKNPLFSSGFILFHGKHESFIILLPLRFLQPNFLPLLREPVFLSLSDKKKVHFSFFHQARFLHHQGAEPDILPFLLL